MHDAGTVCLVERVGDLDCRLQRLLGLQRPASQAVRQRLTLEVFEHEVVDAALMAHVIQRADVWMSRPAMALASRSNRALDPIG